MPTVPSSKRCTSGPRRRKPRASGGTSAGSGGHPRTTWRRCWRRSACTGSCSGPASRCGCRRRAWQSWTCSILRRSSARRSNPRTRHVGLRADPVRRLEWGLLPAVPVPFRGRALAEDAQRAYARWMARQPVAGVAVWAHTGRGLRLSADERRCVLATWRAALSDKVIVAGATSPTMAQEAKAGGADLLLAFPQRDDVVGYHEALGRELPVIAFYLYEAAGGVPYDDATLHAILELPRVIGIKVATLDSAVTFQRIAALARAHPGKLLITGEDRFLGYSVLLGARAALIGMGAALTDLQAELLAAYARRDFATFLSLTSLCDAFGATAFAAPVEGYVQRMLWALGNARASSGGETRVIRATYGPRGIYTHLAARALALWKAHERRWRRKLYHPIGVLWLVEDDDAYERAALPLLKEAGVVFEELTGTETARRYPQISCERVRWAIFERDGGYLTARVACAAVVDAVLAAGGEYRQLAAEPAGPVEGGELGGVRLSDGGTLRADHYVFACGPWLGRLFPDVIGDRVRATRQEVYFFGTPAGDQRFTEEALPVWADHGAHFMYGIPGNEWRGFKIADDTRGPAFDPTSGERLPSPESLAAAREYLALRFPALSGAPLLETRVCQYENSPDEHFIIDRHPRAANTWLVGGGSGHGFKHGPAVGELVADAVLGRREPDATFRLARLGR